MFAACVLLAGPPNISYPNLGRDNPTTTFSVSPSRKTVTVTSSPGRYLSSTARNSAGEVIGTPSIARMMSPTRATCRPSREISVPRSPASWSAGNSDRLIFADHRQPATAEREYP